MGDLIAASRTSRFAVGQQQSARARARAFSRSSLLGFTLACNFVRFRGCAREQVPRGIPGHLDGHRAGLIGDAPANARRVYKFDGIIVGCARARD